MWLYHGSRFLAIQLSIILDYFFAEGIVLTLHYELFYYPAAIDIVQITR